jgi:hypothetical protein
MTLIGWFLLHESCYLFILSRLSGGSNAMIERSLLPKGIGELPKHS